VERLGNILAYCLVGLRHYKNILYVFSLFFAISDVLGQPDNLVFDNYTTEDGLSNNMVQCAFQDSKGWMWFGTNQGLDRFDGYKFVEFKQVPDDTLSMRGALVRAISEDNQGNLWVGTANGGLNKFDRKRNTFKRYLQGKSINKLLMGKDHYLWVGTENGLYKFNTINGTYTEYRSGKNNGKSISSDIINALQFDKIGNLWIATNFAIDILYTGTDSFTNLSLLKPETNNEILEIFADDDGKMWFATVGNGFFIYDTGSQKMQHYFPDINNDRSHCIRKICKDKEGYYWIGTRGGVYKFNKKLSHFVPFSNSDRDPSSLIHNSVLDMTTDKKGDLWICTRGGISQMVSEKQVFKHYKSFADDNRYLNNGEIYAFWREKNGNLWIGTESGGINILDAKTGRFRYLTNLTSNTIKAFAEDNKGNVWVGTYLGGINVINIATKNIIAKYQHNTGNPFAISDNRVWSLASDSFGNIWIGTDVGLDYYNTSTGKMEHCTHIVKDNPVFWVKMDKENDLWVFSHRMVIIYNTITKKQKQFTEPARSMFFDSKGRYWLTSVYRGIILFDKQKGAVKYYRAENGLPNNRTLCIQEDSNGCLWVSTANGLSRFDPEKETFTNYNKSDGLQSNQFNYGATYKLPSGELLFGGVNGFNVFDPARVKSNEYIAPLVFTDFRIFYKPVAIRSEKNAILHNDISETGSITLPYDKNVFMLEFALLNYAKSKKNKYSYILQGFDKNWSDAGQQHTAIYTNLNPGNYTFRVKAFNSDNVANNKELTLQIKVKPPFWGTIWFKAIVILFLLLIVFTLVNFLTYRNRLKHELILERKRAKQIHELDLMKMKFFTNISHEIRTPLTLILGPVEKMLHQKLSEVEIKNHLSIVHRNAQQLLKLVNQLLDFRKLESGNLKLELKKGDIVSFINQIVKTFENLAQDKGIHLKMDSVQKEIFTFFDADKVEKIINNLLSNALKFTNRGGSVAVTISLIIDNTDNSQEEDRNKFIEIVVKDTGIGISESNIDKIFRRFFQSQDTNSSAGTGLGLALTKELVKMHHGRINVESKPNRGTRFTILLPFAISQEETLTQVTETLEKIADEELPAPIKEQDEEGLSKIILIIDDNPDVRYFIRSQFVPEYQVVEAPDGKEGLNLAFKHIPDIIITDIMMPGPDGIELCKKIKKDERTSHIPIILLTALTSKENIHLGLAAGADDYITKPFDISILHTKVENLLSLRKSLQLKYSGEMVLQPKNITITSPDERFLKKAIEIVEKYIDDPELDSDKFASYLGVSRMQLYRKLNVLTDMTVREFIRNIRLKRAVQLLVQNKMNISEVAYAVGFKELSHFRKCFRQEFGLTPSEYIEKHGEESRNIV
jgi:signal transduction histidine kinase/ligand-binding sensor domain-containing protein/AraC-like DNA-binding protein/ActR/RegA family two-component response regulator